MLSHLPSRTVAGKPLDFCVSPEQHSLRSLTIYVGDEARDYQRGFVSVLTETEDSCHLSKLLNILYAGRFSSALEKHTEMKCLFMSKKTSIWSLDFVPNLNFDFDLRI